jgi:hypothetical protein
MKVKKPCLQTSFDVPLLDSTNAKIFTNPTTFGGNSPFSFAVFFQRAHLLLFALACRNDNNKKSSTSGNFLLLLA